MSGGRDRQASRRAARPADSTLAGGKSRLSPLACRGRRALCDNVWLLRSGSAADTQAVADYGELRGAGGAGQGAGRQGERGRTGAPAWGA